MLLVCVLAVLKVRHAFLEMPAVVGKARYILEAAGAGMEYTRRPYSKQQSAKYRDTSSPWEKNSTLLNLIQILEQFRPFLSP